MGVKAEAVAVIQVCVDCLMKRENDEVGELTAERIAELWRHYPDFAEVSIGIPADRHECGIEKHIPSTSRITGDVKCSCGFFYCDDAADIRDDGGCNCEHIDFSSKACDACGSPLAGARQLYTVWAVPASVPV